MIAAMADGQPPFKAAPSLAGSPPRLARLTGIAHDGRPLVSIAGDTAIPASTLGAVTREQLEQAVAAQRLVVVVFLDGRPDAPVLLSLDSPSEPSAPEPSASRSVELELDGERRVIEATRELVLRCGDASITLRSDGTLTLRGRDVTSWARRRQRIRGGSVSIN
jgi:hypothetical protein